MISSIMKKRRRRYSMISPSRVIFKSSFDINFVRREEKVYQENASYLYVAEIEQAIKNTLSYSDEEQEREINVGEEFETKASNDNLQRILTWLESNKDKLHGVELFLALLESFKDSVMVFAQTTQWQDDEKTLKSLQEFVGPEVGIIYLDVEKLNLYADDFLNFLKDYTCKVNLPIVFYNKKLVGGRDDLINANNFNRLDILFFPPKEPVYHLLILGGGIGALSAAIELSKYNKGFKVAVLDWFFPDLPHQWYSYCGLGLCSQGTIPLDIQQEAVEHVLAQEEADRLGIASFPMDVLNYVWTSTLYDIRKYVSLKNWEFRKKLKDNNIEYFCGDAFFQGNGRVTLKSVRSDHETFELKDIIAMSMIITKSSIPFIPSFKGFKNCLSLDVFLLENEANLPNSTLIFGNTPIVFGVATILKAYKRKVTIMTTDKEWLPDIDRSCVRKIMKHLDNINICVARINKLCQVVKVSEESHELSVRGRALDNNIFNVKFDRVLMDYGRVPLSSINGLCSNEKAERDNSSGKLIVDDKYETNVKNIWAFGDGVFGHPESAVFEAQAGRRIVKRICGEEDLTISIQYPKTIILVPIEFAGVGETESSANQKYPNGINVYEYETPEFDFLNIKNDTYTFHTKVICLKPSISCLGASEKVIGLHMLGRNAINLIDGYLIAMEKGMYKEQFLELTYLQSSNAFGNIVSRFRWNEFLNEKHEKYKDYSAYTAAELEKYLTAQEETAPVIKVAELPTCEPLTTDVSGKLDVDQIIKKLDFDLAESKESIECDIKDSETIVNNETQEVEDPDSVVEHKVTCNDSQETSSINVNVLLENKNMKC